MKVFLPDPSLRPSVFDYVALGLTLFGLWLAWSQFKRTREAWQAEVEMQNSLEYNQLLNWIPDLRASLSELDRAVELNNSYAAQRELVRFAQLCRDILHNVGNLPEPDTDLQGALTGAAKAASEAKGDLAMGRFTNPARPVRLIYGQLQAATDQASSHVTRLRATTSRQVHRDRARKGSTSGAI